MSATARTRLLVAALVLGAALLLTLTAPAGTFTIDESNYLATLVALRSGSLGLPGTEGLPASIEWYSFDPVPTLRGAPVMPVMSTAPPYWAPFALPFAPFGPRGLIFLNALCFALTVLLVHRLCAMHAKGRGAPWAASVVFALGAYSIEYARGIWPHMLSLLLVTWAIFCAARARSSGALAWAGAAGLVSGLAAGVRYQNVVVAFALGLGLLLWGERRLRAAGAFALGIVGPLLGAAWINLQRLGLFHPATKGTGYGAAPVAAQPVDQGRLHDLLLSFWSRVVDFSVHPPIPPPSGEGRPWLADPELGAFLLGGAVKKALLQSAPWVVLGWLVMLWAFSPRGPRTALRVELRAGALVSAALLGMFTFMGSAAHDGYAFNPRYLLELLPGAAVAIGWWTGERAAARRGWLSGALAGALLVALIGVAEPYSFARTELIRFAPLLLALGLAAAFALGRRTRAAEAFTAACVVWALGVHLVDDLPASHRVRSESAARLAEVRAALPPGAALFVYGSARDALWPVWAWDGAWVLDLGLDGGRDAPRMVRALLRRGRRVFVDAVPLPAGRLRWIRDEAGVSEKTAPAGLVELVGGAAAAPPE